MGKSPRIQAIDVGSREMFIHMNQAIEIHNIRPVVDRVFDFSETIRAFQYLDSGAHFGKVCIRM